MCKIIPNNYIFVLLCVLFVDDFEDGTFSEGEGRAAPRKKKRLPNRIWLKRAEFNSPKEAEQAVNPMWKKSSSKNTPHGLRVEYRCTGGTYRINECPAGLYLLYHSTSSKVSLFRTDSDHDNHVPDPRRGLSQELKLFIAEKFEEGIQKPNALLALIRQKKMKEPAKTKIITYLKTLRL